MGSCTSKKLQKFMMKLCQMETTNFLLTKSLEFSIKMQMDILTLRWHVNCLTKQTKFMGTNLILIFDSSEVSLHVIIQEFLIAIDMALNGSPEEKLRWGFRIFDKDGSGEEWEPGEIQGSRRRTALQGSPPLTSGSIELKEMTKIMTCLLELEGIGKVGNTALLS